MKFLSILKRWLKCITILFSSNFLIKNVSHPVVVKLQIQCCFRKLQSGTVKHVNSVMVQNQEVPYLYELVLPEFHRTIQDLLVSR